MKVHQKHEKVTQNMHGASRNYRYVWDVSAGSLISDLQDTFKDLRTYQMKFNPAKCTFGVPSGKLMGYIVSERGIEANPKKIKAYKRKRHIINMSGALKMLKDKCGISSTSEIPLAAVSRKASRGHEQSSS